MAYVIPSINAGTHLHPTNASPRRAPIKPASTEHAAIAVTPAQEDPAEHFRALFSGTATPAVPEPAQKPAPTAESVFGASPWVANPTGTAPNGQLFAYNPFYFATPQTAAKVAAMVGGTVVDSNVITPTGGGGFAQSQPNCMVRLADGRLINPGLVASFYTHGYPQSYVDRMIAEEIRST